MKTTAIILGVLSVFEFSACRCNIDEDENRKRDQKNSPAGVNRTGVPESDTLSIQ
ncbi:hypothetical protein [Chryseobacterium culicis]|uniref:hypothetical protein n=1 Tax=Chryseobacterium culicis TaxID=680127 RepID=UPI0018763D65|nr:hypothetical protein [Chryseobacterium culicis]MBE4948856.1 hypothetical protein [Chryseobacterium culicis]